MNFTLEPTPGTMPLKQERNRKLALRVGTHLLQVGDPSVEAGSQAQLASAKLDALLSSSADEEADCCPPPPQTP